MRANKNHKKFGTYLRETYKDGFPDGTAYQRQEAKKFRVAFENVGDEFTKVILTIPVWTTLGQITKTVDFGIVHKDGWIFKSKGDGTIRGNIKNNFAHLAWNRI